MTQFVWSEVIYQILSGIALAFAVMTLRAAQSRARLHAVLRVAMTLALFVRGWLALRTPGDQLPPLSDTALVLLMADAALFWWESVTHARRRS